MGKFNIREVQCYTTTQLTQLRQRPPFEQRYGFFPQPPIQRFRVELLPPQYAVLYENSTGMFFSICLWGTCANSKPFPRRYDGPIQGRNLNDIPIEDWETAQTILLEHLRRKHNIRQEIVPPFEPYGILYQIPPKRVWE